MAFSFSNAVTSGGGFGGMRQAGSETKVIDAPELQEIQTDQLGFSSINGDSQLQFLPSPWPTDALPPPTSSLLSVASTKGLLAAAGPESVVLASTESVREGFRARPLDVKEKLRAFNPQITIPQARPTQVAFSSDESVLVVSCEAGGLNAFQVDSIRNGQTAPALQISTNGASLRALVPNPVPESAELFAAVTSNGDLLLADLKAGQLRSGDNGNILRKGVSCLSWSNRGKQLVAGLSDGTAVQMKPDGNVVAEIPRSVSIPPDCHVSGISWLENDTFFVIYTPNDTNDGIQPSEYYIVTREPKTSNYTFHKLPEVIPAFGVERIPSYHFIARLRNFPPHIQDLLILTATAGTDVGLISKTDKPLSEEGDTLGNFTFTTIADDRRRAQLPLTKESMDTTPIGMVVDLSSNEKVPNPIPSDVEILETDGPVPNLLILNNEGILVSFWLIYTDSVKEKTLFSGFVNGSSPVQVQGGTQNASEPSPVPAQSPFAPPSSTFGQQGFGSATPFNKPAETSFNSGSASSGFGSLSSNAFGKPSTIGSTKSSWATTGFGGDSAKQMNGSGFGQPAFGAATPISGGSAPAFGAASAIGGKPSPFGQPSAPSNAAFGKPSFGTSSGPFGTTSSASPFGATPAASGSSGFAAFSNNKGFAGFGNTNPDQGQSPFGTLPGKSIFSQPSSDSSFGIKDDKGQSSFGTATGKSIFGQSSSDNLFGPQKDVGSNSGTAKPITAPSTFNSAGGFKLDSTFKGDGSAKDDLPKPAAGSGFGFGSAFANILNEPKTALSPTHDKEAEMGEGNDTDNTESAQKMDTSFSGFSTEISKKPPQTLITPPSTLTQPKTTSTPPLSSLFGTSNQKSTTPLPQTTTPAWTFGQVPSTTPKETPTAAPLFGTVPQSAQTPAFVQKSEPAPVFGNIPKIASPIEKPEGKPLKVKEEPASDEDSVDLSKIPEAPLPPDPISKPNYVPGDTSGSSAESSKSGPNITSRSQEFLPANRSANDDAAQTGIPSDDEDDEFSSDFEGSVEDVTEDVSPIDEPSDDQAEHIQTSPESSYKSGERSPEASPAGGLFTKVSNNAAQKVNRPLFGEVGTGPIFAPPKPHESPRSPSPVRHPVPNNHLKVESARSVSVPAYPRSTIDKRKTEYAQSALASQAARSKEEEATKERERQAGLARSKAEAQEQQAGGLADDEDERLRQELDEPIQACPNLDQFITYQPDVPQSDMKSGIPAQIERLYRDINSMVYTLGINARSLSSFLTYQHEHVSSADWPRTLSSDTPFDALNSNHVLGDIPSLYQADAELEIALEEAKVIDVSGKLESCQMLLGRDLFELRTKLTALRKTLHSKKSHDNALAAPLSAEQASIQNDLRKATAGVQAKLAQVEDALSILRAKIAELGPPEAASQRPNVSGRSVSQKKPTVEAVTNTITKMTAMAEKKSADIDVLEAQLKKMDISFGTSTNGYRTSTTESFGTPNRNRRSVVGTTPKSPSNSVYHTPESKFSGTPNSASARRSTPKASMGVISLEDRERWQAKARRKKEVASILEGVLENRKQSTFHK